MCAYGDYVACTAKVAGTYANQLMGRTDPLGIRMAAQHFVRVGDIVFTLVTPGPELAEDNHPVSEGGSQSVVTLYGFQSDNVSVNRYLITSELLQLGEQRRLPRKYWVLLDTFDGTNMPLDTFLAKVENCSRYNGCVNWTSWLIFKPMFMDVGETNSRSFPHLLALLKGRFGSEGKQNSFAPNYEYVDGSLGKPCKLFTRTSDE